ncbi:MAG: ComEC/Rec2 family competence protein [Rariglobus sp.]
MTSRSLGHRAPLLWVLLPLMAGLIAGKLQWLPLPPVLLAVAGVLCIAVAITWKRAWTAGLITGVFLSGAAYYDLSRDRLPDWDALPPREARVTLSVDRVFPPKADMRTLSGLGQITDADIHLADLIGQCVYFSLTPKPGEAPPIRSSRMEITGVLQTLPRDPPIDTFEGYLANQGINFKLGRARITGDVTPANAYHRFCDAALRRFNAILAHGIGAHEQESVVLRAMLLGQQQELSDEQKGEFRESGTMHLFSVSGLHIAVIAAVITGLLTLLRLPPLARFFIGGLLLWLYVDITGGTPSAVRAFVMVMFVHASFVLRVPGNPLAALVASAVCVLAVAPLQLFTASFQLSYGIVAALLMLGLPLGEMLCEKGALFTMLPKVSWAWHHRVSNWAGQKLLSMLAIGLATTVISTISGVVIFQLFTPVSLLANLVLIPVGSLVIISGFLALLCGLVGFSAGALLLNHASVLLLKGVDHGVNFFVNMPWAFHSAVFSPDWLGFIALAGLFGVIFHGYAVNWENRRGGYWLPFAYTLLVLAIGMRFPVA